ncbi:myrcene synthase [Quercus suber]|uniref:Myrcene synthase n=1 Tax=Quercus suber TaxID=58331 RepID=A0AAW0MDI2_QUESU
MKRILEALYNDDHNGDTWKENLYTTALKFRLLRQHGYRMSPEVFNNFKDERRNFKECLCEDAKVQKGLYRFSVKAKWYYSEYTPNLEEYLKNAWITISSPIILMHSYFIVANPITKEALECLEEYPKIIHWSSMILRLTNDHGTSTDELRRGDIPKSIQCCMNETGAFEKDAREYIKSLISTA